VLIKIYMTGIITYFKESFEELKNNVTPPTFSQGQSLTILVAIFSIIFSLIIWGIDSVFGEVMKFYFNLFGYVRSSLEINGMLSEL